MDGLAFRRLAGADPQHPEAAVLEHAAGCPRCAGYLRQTLELADIEVFRWIDHVDEMKTSSALFLTSRLSRPDVHAHIHSHRIGRNNLPADFTGKLNRHSRLTDCGRPNDDY